MAERQDSITVKGERSSWEAEAMNSACFCWLAIRGRIMRQVNTQKNDHKSRIPVMSAAANCSRRRRMVWYNPVRG